ncbi:potassium transporter TrkA [Campylobacter upsaliensis]
MNHILIIIDGILAKHFLERLCFQKSLSYFFTIVYQKDESVNLKEENEFLELHQFDPTSSARLERIMKPYKQAFIYMQDEFETKKTYEALRGLDLNLEINIMDFWGLGINDKLCHLIDARMNLSKRLIDFLPDVALTAQYIGLGVGEIMEIKIPAGSIFAYRHIDSIQQKRWRIVLVYRNEKIHFIKPSLILKPGDSILIVGDPAILQSVFHNVKASTGQFPVPFGTNIYTIIDMKNMSQNAQKLLLNTTLSLIKKTNARKFFIRIINPTLNAIYYELKTLALEYENIFFDFENTNFKKIQSFLEQNDIGVFITDYKHFEKEKKELFELKIPILKIGTQDFESLEKSVILSSYENEIENQANVIVDLSKQLKLEVNFYYYQPNHKENNELKDYVKSLSKLYDKNIELFQNHTQNPILNLEYRENLLQFVSFTPELLEANIGRIWSMDLNRNYYKLSKNYQLFIPIS